MSTEVVTVMNRIPDRAREPYYHPATYLASLARFDATPTILGLNESWGGLMTKPRRLRHWLRSGACKAEILIVCDGFDIVFTVHPDEVSAAYRERWPELPIVFNAEKGIFPRGELAHVFDRMAAGPWPWKYLNSGFMIGPPATILSLLEAMWLDDIADDFRAADDLHGGTATHVNPNDQGWYQTIFTTQVVPMTLDYGCQICQCFSGCALDEFDLSGPRIRNVLTGETPLVAHLNGNAKDLLMPAFLRYWGLEG